MTGVMAMTTQSNAIINAVSQIGIFSPRFYVVNVQSHITPPAILARLPISIEYFLPECYVLRIFKVLIAKCGNAAFPIGVINPKKMRVSWGDTTSAFTSFTDFSLVFFGKFYPSFCTRDTNDGFLSRFGCHQLRLTISFLRKVRDFLAYFGTLRNVVVKVTPSHFARVGAKLFAPTMIRETTLYAD